MAHETAGDPVRGLKWTRRTTAKIAAQLRTLGIDVCARTVARLLKAMGFSLRVNHKKLAGASHPNRKDRGEGIDRDAAGKCRRATHPGGRQARQSAGEVSRTAAGCAARARPSRTSAQRTGLCTMRRRVTAPGSGTRRSGRRLGAPTDDGCGCFVCAWEADICDACEDNPCACEATT